jgi:hypothetical protein
MGLDRAFLALLQGRFTLVPLGSEDEWGNTVYGAPIPDRAAYIGSVEEVFGTDANQNRQEDVRVFRVPLTTDFYGIKVRDKILLDGDPRDFYVVDVRTNHDEYGADYYQNVTAETTERG